MEQAKKKETEEVVQEVKPEIKSTSQGFFWFIAQGTLLKGPYSTNELKKLIDKKEISEKFFAWRDGYKEWRPLYGVDELNLEKEVEVSYPTVPVPGQSPAANMSLQKKINQRQMPVFKVRFTRSRWSDLRKSEFFGIFLISISFTLCFLYLAFQAFEKEWSQVWGKRSSEMLYSVGNVPDSLPTYMYDPLLSAPGLKTQEEHWVPVQVESGMDHYHPNKLAGMRIETHLPPEANQNLNWDKSNTYTRRMRVQGYMNLKALEPVIEIDQPGLPFEPVTSKRLLK